MNPTLLSKHEHANALALNLPSGRIWNAKHRRASNLYKFLLGLAGTFQVADASIQRFIDQTIPSETEDFISEWEEALGIPGDCFKVALTDDLRRRNIKIKLATLAGINTAQDFVDLASLFDLVIEVTSGIDHVATGSGGYATATPVMTIGGGGTFADLQTARFTMVVKEFAPGGIVFPWEFSAASGSLPVGLKFANEDQNSLRCLIEKLKPANSQVLFVEG